MTLGAQFFTLLLLAVPIASVSWTVTHEELFAEARRWCVARSRTGRTFVERKFFYLFTCEYCFSHWVTLGFLVMTGFQMILMDWRGAVIAGFSLVWVANVYMSLFGRLRLDIKHEREEIAVVENELARVTRGKRRDG